jgi:hypothetical protein
MAWAPQWHLRPGTQQKIDEHDADDRQTPFLYAKQTVYDVVKHRERKRREGRRGRRIRRSGTEIFNSEGHAVGVQMSRWPQTLSANARIIAHQQANLRCSAGQMGFGQNTLEGLGPTLPCVSIHPSTPLFWEARNLPRKGNSRREVGLLLFWDGDRRCPRPGRIPRMNAGKQEAGCKSVLEDGCRGTVCGVRDRGSCKTSWHPCMKFPTQGTLWVLLFFGGATNLVLSIFGIFGGSGDRERTKLNVRVRVGNAAKAFVPSCDKMEGNFGGWGLVAWSGSDPIQRCPSSHNSPLRLTPGSPPSSHLTSANAGRERINNAAASPSPLSFLPLFQLSWSRPGISTPSWVPSPRRPDLYLFRRPSTSTKVRNRQRIRENPDIPSGSRTASTPVSPNFTSASSFNPHRNKNRPRSFPSSYQRLGVHSGR